MGTMANGLPMDAGHDDVFHPVKPRNGLNGLKPIYTVNSSEFGGRKIRKVSDKEYQRDVTIGHAPDTFPCGHVLCHDCIRKHMTPSVKEKLCCPLCGKEAAKMFTADPGNSLGYNVDDVDNITLLSNFEDMTKKFHGLKHTLRRLHKESVQSRSLAMTFTNCGCHLCGGSHGTLQVLQEFNQLAVQHVRPKLPPTAYYRYGDILYCETRAFCYSLGCAMFADCEIKNIAMLKCLDHAISNEN